MNSKTIVRNTVWYGLENLISFSATLITSVVIARTLGPSRMGYIIYVMWIANMVQNFGSIGIPSTTRKYMAEYLGGKDFATARFIYRRTLWFQVGVATLTTIPAIGWILWSAPAEFRLAALLLVIGIFPSMVNLVSAQANVATEELSANVPASVAATATFFVLTLLSVFLHWGVVGIASAMLGMRVADCVVRLVPTYRRIHRWPADGAISDALRGRMLSFAIQSVTGMVLTLIVWDRSEVFLLKHLSADIRQVAFYSVAFSLAERLLVFPTVFASATGASVFAQYGRDRSRLPSMTAASARYLGLTSIPLHVLATSLAGAALLTMYGRQYRDAVAVAMAAPILCLPKAFLGPIQTLFETVERQKYFIWVTIVASIIDVFVAYTLIPRHGAVGAALGSGAAQFFAVSALWAIGIRTYKIRLPWGFLGKVTGISIVSAAASYAVVTRVPALAGLIFGGMVAAVSFLMLAWLLRIFEAEDLTRLKVLVDACPAALATPVTLTYGWLSRRITPTEELL